MIDFKNSQYLLYIIILSMLVFIAFFIYTLWRRKAASLVLGKDFKKSSLLLGNYRLIFIKEILIVFAIILSALCLLQPMWGTMIKDVEYEGTDVVVALDVSRSMKARDVSPDRLTKAKDVVGRIAESLKGDRIGLILFAGESFLMCPLTSDIPSFMMFLDAADTDSIRVQGTNFPALLKEGERVFLKKRLSSKMMIIITDGENHEKGIEKALDFYKKNGISITTVAVGTGEDYIPLSKGSSSEAILRDEAGNPVRTVPDSALLKSISSATGGHFIDISTGISGMQNVYNEISKQQKQVFGQGIVKEKKERTWIFILLLLIVLSAELMILENRRVIKK